MQMRLNKLPTPVGAAIPKDTTVHTSGFLAFILSEKAAEVSHTCFFIYSLLRADAICKKSFAAAKGFEENKIISGLTEQDLLHHSKTSPLLVKKSLERLQDAGWIQILENDTYQLGVIYGEEYDWLVGKTPVKRKVDTRERLKNLIEESLKRKEKPEIPVLSDDVRLVMVEGILKKQIRGETPVGYLTKRYKSWYFDKYKSHAENDFAEGQAKFKLKAKIFLGRFISCCGDLETAVKLMEFAFEKWEPLSEFLKFDGRPTISLFGTKALCHKIADFKDRGNTSVGERRHESANESDPDHGF